MEISIQSPSFHASEKLTDFTADKVEKLGRFTDRIVRADVLLKTHKSGSREVKVCEIRLAIPGNDLFVSKKESTFEESVLNSVEALKQQLLSWKDRVQDRSHTPAADVHQSDD